MSAEDKADREITLHSKISLEEIEAQAIRPHQAVVVEEKAVPAPPVSRRAFDQTQPLFCGGRMRQGRYTAGATADSLQGVFSPRVFLPSQHRTLTGISDRPGPSQTAPLSAEREDAASELPSAYVMERAREAFARTRYFLEQLAERTPAEKRRVLEQYLLHMPGPPRLMPSESAIQRFEVFARTVGYHGPVLWYMPHAISVEQLAEGGMVSRDWWHDEPNFQNGLPTLSPYEPPEVEGVRWTETGYWVLALPGIMPGTAKRTFSEQNLLLTEVARTVGLEVNQNRIARAENMNVLVRTAPETVLLFALAQNVGGLLTRTGFSVRTAQPLRTYQPDVDPRSSILPGENWPGPVPSLYRTTHICVGVAGDEPLTLHDRGDEADMLDLGLCPFFIPFVY